MRYPLSPNMIAEEMADPGIPGEVAQTDTTLLRRAIIAELDATNLYEQMAAATKNKRLKEIFLDVAKEEKIHVGEFEKLLGEIDKEHIKAVEDGAKEVGKA